MQNKATSLLGLAVMKSPLPDGYTRDKCQLVVLDTLIHRTLALEKALIKKDPILVTFQGDKFLSCALVSDKQALVFTSPKTILVSLVNLTQKILEYP